MAFGATLTLPTITGSHSDYPVVLRNNDFPSSAIDGGTSSILNGGGNLRAYTDDTKTTQLPLDVVTFVTGGTPEVVVYTKIPVAATGNTIFIEADDTETSQPSVTGTYGRNAVWADYTRVYHLDDNTSITDSAGNGSGETISGTPAAGTPPWGLGNCIDFDGTNDKVVLSTSTFVSVSEYVFQAIVELDTLTTNHHIMGTGDNPGAHIMWADNDGFESGRTNCVSADSRVGGSGGRVETATNSIATATPYLLHFRSNENTNTASVAINGAQDPNTSTAGTVDIASGEFSVGGNAGFSTWFNGRIAEVRVRETSLLSDDWMSTEHDMFSSTAGWVTVGAWEDSGGGGLTASLTATLDDTTLSSSSSSTIEATVSPTLEDHSLNSTASSSVMGTLTSTLDDTVLSSSTSTIVSSTLTNTLEDYTLSSTASVGNPALSASLTATLEDTALSSSSSVLVSADLTETTDGTTLTSSASSVVSADLASTLDDTTLDSTVSSDALPAASLDVTLQDTVLVSTTSSVISASVSSILDGHSLQSSTSSSVVGSLTATLEDHTLTSTVVTTEAPKIDGQSFVTISANGGSVEMYFNGTDYFTY